MTANKSKQQSQNRSLRETLSAPNRRLAEFCDRPETPLVGLLHVLEYNESFCLHCRTDDCDLFLDWDHHQAMVHEIERTDTGIRGPHVTGTVRAAAAIETAETVDIVSVSRTPFADRSFHSI